EAGGGGTGALQAPCSPLAYSPRALHLCCPQALVRKVYHQRSLPLAGQDSRKISASGECVWKAAVAARPSSPVTPIQIVFLNAPGFRPSQRRHGRRPTLAPAGILNATLRPPRNFGARGLICWRSFPVNRNAAPNRNRLPRRSFVTAALRER